MARRTRNTALAVWMNGVRVGTWKVTPSRGHEFSYEPSWLEHAASRPISMSMPLRPTEPYRGDRVSDFFDNLLPENRAIRERLQHRFSAGSTRAFDLLEQVGRDCVGAIQLLPMGAEPTGFDRIEAQPMSDAEIATLLRRTVVDNGPFNRDEADDFRISLAGAQEKTALLRYRDKWMKPLGATPTTHIFKLPLGIAQSGIDLSTSVENEWICSEIVRGFGLSAAQCRIAEFEEKKTLIVERFDRKPATGGEWIVRLPQEDFAQVMGLSPQAKYESEGGPGIRSILDYLLGSEDAEGDRRRFMTTQVVFWLLCAIDGHSKNFSVFIEPKGRFRSTPLYDVLSAYPVVGHSAGKLPEEKARMAMAVWGKNRHYRWSEIRRKHFISTATDCGLGAIVKEIVDDVVARADQIVTEANSRLPPGFPQSVAGPIFDGVLQAAKRLAA